MRLSYLVKIQPVRLLKIQPARTIDAFKKAGDEGRIPRPMMSTGYPKDLEALVRGVEDARDPLKRKIFFLRRVPRDPMYPDPSVDAAMTWGKRSYASEAETPRDGDDLYDVFSLSDQVGLNGVPYRKW